MAALHLSTSGPRHFVPFDGLRGIAIALVFCCHYATESHFLYWGWTGVDLFFVLSGFLITGILYDSVPKPHFFRTFYIRRALRIFPLYYAFWVLALIAVPVLHTTWHSGLWLWVVYMGNYLTAHAVHIGVSPDIYTNVELPHLVRGHRLYIVFGHFWSLCVEEQYYLCWPLVVWLVRDRRRLLLLSLSGIAGTIALRVAVAHLLSPQLLDSEFLRKATFARTDELLMGGALALLLRGPQGLSALRPWAVYAAGAAAFVAFVASTIHYGTWIVLNLNYPWLGEWGISLLGIMATVILYAALRVRWFQRALSWRPLVELGRVSYGFYVLHFLVISLVPVDRYPFHAHLRNAVLEFGLSWLLAAVSFHFFEARFLALKDKWAPARETPVYREEHVAAWSVGTAHEPAS